MALWLDGFPGLWVMPKEKWAQGTSSDCHCHVKGKKRVIKFMVCLQGHGDKDVRTKRLKESDCWPSEVSRNDFHTFCADGTFAGVTYVELALHLIESLLHLHVKVLSSWALFVISHTHLFFHRINRSALISALCLCLCSKGHTFYPNCLNTNITNNWNLTTTKQQWISTPVTLYWIRLFLKGGFV